MDINEFQEVKTQTSSPLEFLKFNILIKRDEAIESLKKYNEFRLLKTKPPSNILISRIRALYFCVRASIERNYNKKEFKIFEELYSSSEVKDNINLFYLVEKYLDELQVTKVDIYYNHDKTNAEAENVRKGL